MLLRRRSATNTASTGSPTYLIEIFVISAVALLLEISYTRIISFKLYYYYTYLVIGLALLGLGSGAVIIAVSGRLRALSTRALLAGCTLAAAGGVVVGYVAVAVTPLDTLAIWTGDTTIQLVAVGQLLLICLGLYVSFLPIGMCVSALFARRPDDINRLYFSDLAGAALACLVVVPLVAWVGPVSIIAFVAIVLVGVGMHLTGTTHKIAVGVAVAAAGLLAIVVIVPDTAPSIRTEESKGVRPDSVIEASEWSPLFRVDTEAFPDNTVLYHDGIWGSAIWPWDGDPATLDRFDTDDRSIPFAALGDPPKRVLIIGAAGGNEIAASIHFGAEQIDAVELNPATAGLLRGKYAEYSGNLTERAEVNYVVGDGRSYLARSDEEYDLVWFVAPDSYAASNAASSGAFVLSESYLYTREMLQDSVSHLTENGMVVMQFGEKDYANRPNRTARLAATARDAYGHEDIAPFDEHIAIVTSTAEGFFYGGSTTMMKSTPFTAAELDRIEAQLTQVPNSDARYLPGRPGDDGAPVNQVITLPDSAPDGELTFGEFIDDYPYDISAISDNRPFFWHFTPFSQVIQDLGDPIAEVDVEIGIGERVLLVLLGMSILLATVFLLVPFLLVRNTWKVMPDKATSAPIFALLGLAFIAFEITLIQRFSLFLGYPTYSLTVTLMAILLSTGVGALVSGRWHVRPNRMLAALAVAIVGLGAFYMWIAPMLEESLLAWPLPAKIVLVIALCAPLGFCLGMFMPLAISLVATDPEHSNEYVAWGWAINGFFSVIGSTLTTMVSMTYGFRTVLAISVVLYLVVILLLRRLAGLRRPVDVAVIDPLAVEPAMATAETASDRRRRIASLKYVSAVNELNLGDSAHEDGRFFTRTTASNQGSFTSRDWVLFLSVAGIWGSSFLFIAVGLEALQPGLVTLLRVGSGALALSVVRRTRAPIERPDRARLVVLSAFWVAIPFTLFPIAEQHINSAVAGLLNGATPIFTALVATVLLRQPPRGAQLVGIVVGFVGVALVSLPSLDDGGSEALGVLLVILATVCYGFSVNIAAPLQQRYGSLDLMANVLVLATVWTLPYGLWGLSDSHFELGPVVAVLFLGVFGTGLAFVIMGTLVGRVGATRASTITYVIPVVALALGVIFRDDVVAPLALVGVVFVIGGAFLASRRTAE